MEDRNIYVLKIELEGSCPKIWRRIEVPSDYTFFKLHEIIQKVMPWENCHLHNFEVLVGNVKVVSDEDGSGKNEKRMFLFEYMENADEVRYVYDFGDCWEHIIKLEEIKEEEAGVTYPCCIGGQNASPPEDCGGIGEYCDMLDIMDSDSSNVKEELIDWFGEDFDPTVFDASAVKFQRRLCWSRKK